MSDLNDSIRVLEFLAARANQKLQRQTDFYNRKQQLAGTLIAVVALFIPFFLNGLHGAYPLIKWASVVLTSLLVLALVLLLVVLLTKPFYGTIKTEKYKEMINKPYQEVLLQDIGGSIASEVDNREKTVDKFRRKYDACVWIVIFAVMLSAFLLVLHSFCQPPREPMEVILK